MPTHGKSTYIAMDNAAGALTSVTAYSRSASPTETVDTAETTNFGQNDKTYVVGQVDEKFTIGGTFEVAFLPLVRAVTARQQANPSSTCTVQFGPSGNTTGMYHNDRECLITSIQVTAQAGDLVTMSVEFQRTGPTTEGTY